MAKEKSTPATSLPDPALSEPVYAPPTKGGAYERLPGGDLRKVDPAPIAPTVPATEEK